MIVNTTKLKGLRKWAEDYGMKVRKKGFSGEYARQLFDESNTRQAAIDVRDKYKLVEIDGINFVIALKDIIN